MWRSMGVVLQAKIGHVRSATFATTTALRSDGQIGVCGIMPAIAANEQDTLNGHPAGTPPHRVAR